MIEKLRSIDGRYEEISRRLSAPETMGDQAGYAALMREYKQLTPVVEKFRQYQTFEARFKEAEALLRDPLDPEMKELAELEFRENRQQMESCVEELKVLLLPRDENDDKNVIIEIRGGAGGEEAMLFAAALYRMYTMYAESKGFHYEVLSLNDTELGGIKEIAFSIRGEGAFSRYKFESGVHRVQRVPETESGGRIHTSTPPLRFCPRWKKSISRSIRPICRSIPFALPARAGSM